MRRVNHLRRRGERPDMLTALPRRLSRSTWGVCSSILNFDRITIFEPHLLEVLEFLQCEGRVEHDRVVKAIQFAAVFQ
jgi:hypothetical protein